ncbi:MAG: HAD family hydrolase [Chloroflexota bacterium]|nr:HAD family hydrolase [Chloroflexota bacterium]
MREVGAVCFDLDDTLRDGGGAADALRRTAEKLAALSGVASDVILGANATEWAGLWPEVETAWTLGAMSGAEVTSEAWRRTLGACGVDDPGLVRRATEVHLAEILAEQRLFDDAARLLDALDGQLPLALITNGASDTQHAVLRALDLERRFDAIVISGEVGVAKPDPAAFRLACDRLGTDPSAAWHVGDNLVTDVGGAKSAGLVAVWLNRSRVSRPDQSVEPDLDIGSLDDLTSHIAAAQHSITRPK